MKLRLGQTRPDTLDNVIVTRSDFLSLIEKCRDRRDRDSGLLEYHSFVD